MKVDYSNIKFNVFNCFSMYYLEGNELIRCTIKDYELDFETGKNTYSIMFGETERKFDESDLIGKLFETEIAYKNNCPEQLKPRQAKPMINGKSYRRLPDKITYVEDGIIYQEDWAANKYIYSRGFLVPECADKNVYDSFEHALSFNKTIVKDSDGEHYVGGEWANVQPTEEQRKLIDTMMDAINAVRDSGLVIGYDYNNDSFEFIRNGFIGSNYDYTSEERLSGWYVYERRADIYSHGDEFSVIPKK